jgi:hypothetical protein
LGFHAVEGNTVSRTAVSGAEHPIVSGFHPDPSICRVGEDYYLAHSSFEYFPGAPIFHSRDLVHWKQIGNILDRRSQFVPGGGTASGGIYGPTLRHHGGRFYYITTNVYDSRGQLIVSAEDPAGDWSEPVFVREAMGIDPDLCWGDDGECYLTWTGHTESGLKGILQTRIDPDTGELQSEPYLVWQGTGLAACEAPHMHRIGDYWYLMLAEGGTERGHSVTFARAERPEGPWEACPSNPVFSHRSTALPVQNTGHADLVETASGEWAAAYLAVRPRGFTPQFHVLGRETFLAGVDWVDGWPVFDAGRYEFTPDDTTFTDDFTSDAWDLRWVAASSEPDAVATRTGKGLDLRDPADGSPGLLCTRVKDLRWSAEAEFEDTGRFLLWLDKRHWYGLTCENGEIRAEARLGAATALLGSAPAPQGPVVLRIEAVEPEAEDMTGYGPDDIVLSVKTGEEFTELGRLDGRYLSTEVATGFTGRMLGLGAVGDASRVHAFRYAPTL